MSNKRRKQERKTERADARRPPSARVPMVPPPYRGPVPLEPIDEVRWRVPQRGPMRTDGIVFADETLLPDLQSDRSLEQVANVATLPGIVGHSYAMPDIHWGYGFPIGGVAAFEPSRGGVVSPGGVGYDINCGVRLLASSVDVGQVRARLRPLIEALFEAIPAGIGSRRGDVKTSGAELDGVLGEGLRWALRKGYASKEDLAHVEEGGCLEGAAPELVSSRARQRGGGQLGTLGSGNHFAEIGVVDEIYDDAAALAYGLRKGGVTLMIHSGSRGLGHQVCTDSLSTMLRAAAEYEIPLVDRQLCCAPIESPEGQAYLGAMAAAANFAFVNRQLMAVWAREVFDEQLGAELTTVYDVCHNIAKWEQHPVGTRTERVLVHRKGATRALPAGHPLVPAAYAEVGQPVIIPGDMGRYSFVLRGAASAVDAPFASACHGAGRLLSRAEAKRRFKKSDIEAELEEQGIIVIGASRATVVEEAPHAYKDVADVVDVVHRGGLASRVARIRPLGTVKG